MVFFVLLRGWPLSLIHRRMTRIMIGNVVTVTGGIATYAAPAHGNDNRRRPTNRNAPGRVDTTR